MYGGVLKERASVSAPACSSSNYERSRCNPRNRVCCCFLRLGANAKRGFRFRAVFFFLILCKKTRNNMNGLVCCREAVRGENGPMFAKWGDWQTVAVIFFYLLSWEQKRERGKGHGNNFLALHLSLVFQDPAGGRPNSLQFGDPPRVGKGDLNGGLFSKESYKYPWLYHLYFSQAEFNHTSF